MRHGAIAFEHRTKAAGIKAAGPASISRGELLTELGVLSHVAA
jgi:hypothetical protein